MDRVPTSAAVLASVLLIGTVGPVNAWDRGEAETFAVVPPLFNGEVSSVEGLTVGPDGNIYVPSAGFNSQGALSGNSELFVFDPSGRLVRHVTIENSSPHPLGLAFSPAISFQRGQKSLILCDFGGKQILQVDPFSGDSSVFMNFDPQFSNPGFNGLTFDAVGNVYISDSFQGIIWKTPPNGTGASPGQVWLQHALLNPGQGLNPPFGANGIEFNNSGDTLYVANTAFHTIVRIPVEKGNPGAPTVLTTGINAPDGLVVDRHDNLWIAANQEDEIVVVDPRATARVDGVSTTIPKVIAKRGDFNGVNEDGVPQGLLFPASPAFSPDGSTLYVSNLALFLPFAGAQAAIDSPWTLKVEQYTIGKISAVIPRLDEAENADLGK